MKNNEDLQRDVQNAIKWEPLLTAAEIGVTAKDGVITLTGTVDSYSKKMEAEEAARNVGGVKAVVEKIEVKIGSSWQKNDNDIATEVIKALGTNCDVPQDKVKVKVEKGRVWLSGQVQWDFQKEAARTAIRHLEGVKAVMNNVTFTSDEDEAVEKAAIEGALLRHWSIENEDIDVEVSGHTVTLTGTVNSVYQKNEAARLARNAPGVWNVENNLVIDYYLIGA